MKNPFSSLINWFRPRDELTPMELEKMIRHLNGGSMSSSGVPVTVDNAQGLAAVGVSLRYLGDIISTVPFNVFRRLPDGRGRQMATDLRIFERLHSQPNANYTSTQWRKMGIRDLLLRGNWYNLKVPELRGSYQLVRLHPDATEVRQEDDGSIVYLYRSRMGEMRYTRDQVLHIWLDSDDGIKGLSPIQVYRNTIGEGIALREHGTAYFRSGARPGVILQPEKGVTIDEESKTALIADFDALHSGVANAYKTGFLPYGITSNEVKISMEDAQWIDARKVSAREIFGIFGVPPHKGGDLADATFSNIEHENIYAVIDAIQPRCTAIEQCVNSSLFSGSDIFSDFDLSDLLTGDFKSRQEGRNIQRRAGIINANEWRAAERMNPRDDEGGDEYIIEQNMRIQDGNMGQQNGN